MLITWNILVIKKNKSKITKSRSLWSSLPTPRKELITALNSTRKGISQHFGSVETEELPRDERRKKVTKNLGDAGRGRGGDRSPLL